MKRINYSSKRAESEVMVINKTTERENNRNKENKLKQRNHNEV